MTTITQAISTLPTPPDPATDTPAGFSLKAAASVLAQKTMVTELQTWAGQVNAVKGEMVTLSADAVSAAAMAVPAAVTATTKAAEASASAASAAALAGAFVGTSSTPWTPTTGNVTFTTQAGEQYTAGIWVTVVSASDGTVNGYGQVVSYSGTSLVVNVQVVSGAVSKSDWNISIAGVRGAPGAGITPQPVGFTASGGTTSKTLTVDVDVTASALVTKTGSQTVSGKTFVDYTETVFPLTGTTPAFTVTNGTEQTWTLTGNSTPTDALASGQAIALVITPGAYSITWPAGTWVKIGGGGAVPSLYSAGKTHVLMWKIGATLYYKHMGDN